jgi:hypothetical protein
MVRSSAADGPAGSAAFHGVTSPKSTKPGRPPIARPTNVVPERGQPTTNTSRSSRPSRGRCTSARSATRAPAVA